MKMKSRLSEDQKKAAIALGLGTLLFGTLAWWAASSFFLLNRQQGGGGDDMVSADAFRDELAKAQKATQDEEKYLDSVNGPTELVTDLSGLDSLGLIKTDPAFKNKNSGDTLNRGELDKASPKKVDTLDELRWRMKDKIARMGMGSLFGGDGGSRGGGYSPGDLEKFKGRFGSDSDFKGGGVLTGPAAAPKTKIGGLGRRALSDNKMALNKGDEQLAQAAGQRFGETPGGMGRPVSGDSARGGLANAAEGIPNELRKKGESDANRPDMPMNKPEQDPCQFIDPSSGKNLFLAQLGMGLGITVIRGVFSGPKGIGDGMEKVYETAVSGIGQFLNPNKEIEECYEMRDRLASARTQAPQQTAGATGGNR